MGRATLVTAFYPIRSKFPVEKYLEWISNFMLLKSPIVLFTDAQFEPIMRQIRGPLPIHIVVQPFEQTYMWRTYRDQWIADHGRDREAHIHTPELYAVWANKAVWVKEAIEINPFATEHFFWCDIGAFRDRSLMGHFCEQFPDPARFVRDRVLFSSVERCSADDYELKDNIIGDFYHKNRIVGGLFGGEASACLRWLAAYESMLQRYFSRGRFAGKDQSVMVSALLEDSSLGVVIKPTMNCNEWFFLEYYLSNVPGAEFSEDTTFRVPASKVVSARIMGGIGNQMFQLATAYAFARDLGAEPRFLRNKLVADGRNTYWDTLLENWQPYLTDALPSKLIVLKEAGPMTYSKFPDGTLPNSDGYFLDGYFQTAKYFSKYSADIYKLFDSPTVRRQVEARYNWLLGLGERAVVVHARRTDYLKNEHNINFHGPLTVDYYRRGIRHMATKVKDPVYILFSDDMNFWYDTIRQIPELETGTKVMVNESDTSISLMLMAQFSNFIIANSTFSWWAVWMARGARTTNVVAPKCWFGPAGPKDYENIYEADWIRL